MLGFLVALTGAADQSEKVFRRVFLSKKKKKQNTNHLLFVFQAFYLRYVPESIFLVRRRANSRPSRSFRRTLYGASVAAGRFSRISTRTAWNPAAWERGRRSNTFSPRKNWKNDSNSYVRRFHSTYPWTKVCVTMWAMFSHKDFVITGGTCTLALISSKRNVNIWISCPKFERKKNTTELKRFTFVLFLK